MKCTTAVVIALFPYLLFAKIWNVGPLENYTKPSEVSTQVSAGDTVFIQSGIYLKDVCKWSADNLHLIGINGKAHLNAEKSAYGGKAIWVITGNNCYVENIEFSNCAVIDLNGAGIRLEGKNLHVTSCYFHDNQEGILAGDNPESEVIVEYSEFANNGAGDGFSHNIYINHLKSLLFQYNYVHHAFYGHEIKSRAYKNIILYNRISNEDGSASYEIDLPNGGPALIMGNIIQQSHFSENNTIISYGREGLINPGPHNFIFVNNTVINLEDNGVGLNIQSNSDTIFSANNLFAGKMNVLVGIPKTYLNINNIYNQDLNYFNFLSTSTYDFHLTSGSPGIDSAVKLNQYFDSYLLQTDKEYLHPVAWKKRFNDLHPDLGAFELQQLTKTTNTDRTKINCYYDFLSGCICLDDTHVSGINLEVYDLLGRKLTTEATGQQGRFKIKDPSNGLYHYILYRSDEDKFNSGYLNSGVLWIAH